MTEFASAAVANAFVDLAGTALPQMKLQKLTYMANGWNLAISGEPLVSDIPEAWDNGPVFRLIWDQIRDFGRDAQGHVLNYDRTPYKADLSASQAQVVQHVWKRYGSFGQFHLSEMTHQPGTPWTQTYFAHGRNAPIPNEIVRQHYRDLALAGRARA